jgi:hypothetical protein
MANEIKLTFAGDSAKLERSFDKVGAGARKMETQVGQASTKSVGHFGKFQAAAVAGVAVVGAALFKFGKDSVAAFTEAEEAQTKLEDAFRRFPTLADTNIESLRQLNTALAKKTKFDDDALASGQAILAQFKLSGTQIKDLTPLLADYAAKTGQDIPGAADALGKAFLGNTKALKSLGISYKSTGNQAKDVTNITALLRKQVGGFAEQQGKTAAGQAAIMNNQFGELKETLGQKLLPVMLKATNIGLKVVDWIAKNKTVVLPLIGVIAAVAAAQWAWNIAMAANPIGLIVVAIAAVVAGLVLFATKTEIGRKIVGMLWSELKIGWSILKAIGGWFAGPFVNFFVKGWHFITWQFTTGLDVIKSIPGKIGNAFKKVYGFLTAPFRSAFNFIADAWNNTVGKLHWSVPKWVPKIGGNSIGAPQLPHFHSGGVVPGAPGSEMLAVLQAGERVTPAGQSSGMTLTIAGDDSRTSQFLMWLIRRAVKEQGGNVQTVLGT